MINPARLSRVALAALALGAGAPLPVVAQVPNEEWRTLETPHFRVTFPEDLEMLGRRAADRAEWAWSELSEHFIDPPDDRIDLLLTDHSDLSNGYATVTPSNRIVIFARPPADQLSIGYADEWLELVITHELAHIVHLDHVDNPVGRLGRALFGRVALEWPFFPGLATPRWVIEGLATWYESRLTSAGRVRGTFHEMILRTAALEGRFESIGQAGGESPLWPGGNRAYAYGSLFFDWLLDRHGEEMMAEFVRAVGSQWIPYRIDSAARGSFGVSLTDEWQLWRAEYETNAARLDEELQALGPVNNPERLTRGARWGLRPVPSPDGRFVAFLRSDGTSDIQLRLLDLETLDSRPIGRTNNVVTFDWLSDGQLLVSQIDLDGPYQSFSDLYRFSLDGRQERVTHGERLTQPSVHPDGERAVAVQEGGGSNALVVVDLGDGTVSPLVSSDPDVHWSMPTWSPNGRWIAVARWEVDALHDIVILDGVSGAEVSRVTRDRASDMAPTWSADGGWLLWSSDRTGILNIFGARVSPASGTASAPVRLSNVRTGAAFPGVDPAGEWLYFSGYHVDGWDVERIPFDPEAGVSAAPALARFAQERLPPERGASEATVSDYSPWPTLGPTYWEVSLSEPVEVPTVDQDPVLLRGREVLGAGIGLETGGRDLVSRHAWSVVGRVTTSNPKFVGGASYSWAGLGNPILSISGSQDYDAIGQLLTDPELDTLIVLERERTIRGTSTILAPSWRRNLSLTLSGGVVWQARTLLDERLDVSSMHALQRPEAKLLEGQASIQWNSARSHSFQLGLARGFAVFLTARTRREVSLPDSLVANPQVDRSFDEGRVQVRGGLPLWKWGHARHTLAVRWSGGTARGAGAGAFHYRVGGASGSAEQLTGLEVFGGNFIFFPARGYARGSRFGRHAWSASAEYRFPIRLLNWGFRAWPIHVDRVVGSAFFDTGNAWGPDVTVGGFDNRRRSALASIGGEVTVQILSFFDREARVRGGVGFPLIEGNGAQFWVRAGLSF